MGTSGFRKVIILLALLVFSGRLVAQAPPVELQVMPSVQQSGHPHTSFSTNPYSDATITTSDRTQTSYVIQLSRAMTPLPGVRVRWAILVQSPSGRSRLVQGERTCDVPIRDAVTIKTQPITTGLLVRSTTNYAEYPFNTGSTVGGEPADQIKGYEVEVFVGGSRVIVKAEPSSIQEPIEAMRSASQKTPAIPPSPHAP